MSVKYMLRVYLGGCYINIGITFALYISFVSVKLHFNAFSCVKTQKLR